MPKQKEENKYSVLKSVFSPFLNIADNLERFLLSGILFALGLTLLSYIFNQTYLCVINVEAAKFLSCGGYQHLYGVYIFLKVLICSLFITVWCYLSTHDELEKNIYRYFLKNWKKFFHDLCFFICFVFLNILPVISGVLLLFRVPNPNWQIELLYFTFVGLGFIVPFIVIRFYTNFAEALSGEDWRNFSMVWHQTSGKGFKIILSTGLFFLIEMILLLSVNSSFRAPSNMPPLFYNFIAEFIFNLMTLLMIALIVNFMQEQKAQIVENSRV